MRLKHVHIVSAPSCGGLLDGLKVNLVRPRDEGKAFQPLCMVGPNGSGKSQFLQVLAEIFQSAWHAVDKSAERQDSNPKLQFAVEYSILQDRKSEPTDVRLSRVNDVAKKAALTIEYRKGDVWTKCSPSEKIAKGLLPALIVGYTSGGNETLSVPFFVSRAGYAADVAKRALKKAADATHATDPRLMFIDFGTHLEVLAANLILGNDAQRTELLRAARLTDLHSLRCVIQLARRGAGLKVRLTKELNQAMGLLRRCATCWQHDEDTQTLVLDFHLNSATRKGFGTFWVTALRLYTVLHKFAMLNDLAISKSARTRFNRELDTRRFASHLPEPQDEEKVFRFELVRFRPAAGNEIVDYVALSDGEHQLAQILGTMCMVSISNVLFLMDEPESHFNPDWRVKFVSSLLNLPTVNGKRSDTGAKCALQEALISTHSPFMASDLPRDQVLLFKKAGADTKTGKACAVTIDKPEVQTFGATFDTIVEHCFGVRPPISTMARTEFEKLMKSDSPEEIKVGLNKLADSVDKFFLKDRLRQLEKGQGQ